MSARPRKKPAKKTNKRWQRPAPRQPRAVPAQDLVRCSSPFYGISAELLAGWCEVSVELAAAWKAGGAQPSPAEMKLFLLYSREQVLDAMWWQGWIARRSVLVDPEGNECRQSLLRAYPLIVQLARRLVYESANRDMIELFERTLAAA